MSETVVRTTAPFRLDGLVKTPLPAGFNRWLESLVEKTFGLSRLDRLYRELPPSSDQLDFLRIVLDLFNIRYTVNQRQEDAIPTQGPAILVANHPFGGLDGVLLAHYLLQRRRDVKFMANYILGRIPELQELFISVDPFGGDSSRVANIRPLREALRWLKSGGLLVIFPAGEVSHLHASRRQVIDPEWNPSVARIIRATPAPVIPVCFEGANSAAFQVAGLLHDRLRTMLLPRELLNKEHKTFELSIGEPVPANRLASFESNPELMRFLRLQTYSLYRGRANARDLSARTEAFLQPVAPPVPAERVAAEIAALPEHQVLVESGDFRVCYAYAAQLPGALLEIGRLRELTFRATGEGTGRPSALGYRPVRRLLFAPDPVGPGATRHSRRIPSGAGGRNRAQIREKGALHPAVVPLPQPASEQYRAGDRTGAILYLRRIPEKLFAATAVVERYRSLCQPPPQLPGPVRSGEYQQRL